MMTKRRPIVRCAYCKTPIHLISITWVDGTDGDVCWGNPLTGENENGVHTAPCDVRPPRTGDRPIVTGQS